MSLNAFELHQASLRFGSNVVLRDITLSIRTGQSVALIGRSGCGKTSLLKLFNGVNQACEGRVCALGQEVDSLNEASLKLLRSRIGFVLQNHGLIGNLSVLRNVLAGAYGRQSFWGALRDFFIPSMELQQAVLDVLAKVSIPEKLFERLDSLSLGQQQRVAIARALFQNAEAVFADEPVASLDPVTAHEILALLTSICRSQNATLIASLHDLDLVRHPGYFERVIALKAPRGPDGQRLPAEVVFDGSPADLSDEVANTIYGR